MKQAFQLGVITDVHLAPAGSPARGFINPYPFERAEGMLADAVAWFGERGVDAVAVLGDLVMFEDDASLDLGLSRIAALGVPVLIVPGNHDGEQWNAAVERNLPNRELPGWPTIATVTQVEVKQNPESWRTGGLETLDNQPVVILSHFPVVNVRAHLTGSGLPYAGDAEWDNSIASLAERSSPVLVLSGHVHTRYEIVDGPVLQLGFASLIEPPHAAAIVDVLAMENELRVDIEHIDIAEYDVSIVPILSPARSSWVFRSGSWTNGAL